MIVGVGIDIIEIDRITAMPSVQRRILSDAERSHYKNFDPLLIAKLFTAKEAFVKALGTGFRAGIFLHHLSVIDSTIHYSEEAKVILQQKNVKQVYVSMMTNDNYAISWVLLR